MTKKIYLLFFMSIFFLVGSLGFSHPGALDKNGGHTDKKTGKYHSHKKNDKKATDKKASTPTTKKAPDKKAPDTTKTSTTKTPDKKSK